MQSHVTTDKQIRVLSQFYKFRRIFTVRGFLHYFLLCTFSRHNNVFNESYLMNKVSNILAARPLQNYE